MNIFMKENCNNVRLKRTFKMTSERFTLGSRFHKNLKQFIDDILHSCSASKNASAHAT